MKEELIHQKQGIFHKFRKHQILAKRGPDSRFSLKANLTSLCPRSSRSSILKTYIHVQAKHEYKPGSYSLEYYRSYTNTDSYKSQICKFWIEYYSSLVLTPNLTWYSTLNNNQIPSFSELQSGVELFAEIRKTLQSSSFVIHAGLLSWKTIILFMFFYQSISSFKGWCIQTRIK